LEFLVWKQIMPTKLSNHIDNGVQPVELRDDDVALLTYIVQLH
jgi:hypothetical protein